MNHVMNSNASWQLAAVLAVLLALFLYHSSAVLPIQCCIPNQCCSSAMLFCGFSAFRPIQQCCTDSTLLHELLQWTNTSAAYAYGNLKTLQRADGGQGQGCTVGGTCTVWLGMYYTTVLVGAGVQYCGVPNGGCGYGTAVYPRLPVARGLCGW